MTYIRKLLGRQDDDILAENLLRGQDMSVITDTRSPFERIRDNYESMQEKYECRLEQLNKQLEQLKTDISECEAIIVSLSAGRSALSNEIVERGLLGNDPITQTMKSNVSE